MKGIFCSSGWSLCTACRLWLTSERTHKDRGGGRMKQRTDMRLTAGLSVIVSLLVLAGSAAGFTGGPQIVVTDQVPSCAVCHSMVKADYTPERPAERSAAELPANKHYTVIEAAE